MHSFEPYKEDSESFLEPPILCLAHVPSQAGEVKTRIHGLSTTYVYLLLCPGNDEQDLNLFVRECVKAEFPMVAPHPTVANTSERQLLHSDN